MESFGKNLSSGPTEETPDQPLVPEAHGAQIYHIHRTPQEAPEKVLSGADRILMEQIAAHGKEWIPGTIAGGVSQERRILLDHPDPDGPHAVTFIRNSLSRSMLDLLGVKDCPLPQGTPVEFRPLQNRGHTFIARRRDTRDTKKEGE